MNTYVNFRYLS